MSFRVMDLEPEPFDSITFSNEREPQIRSFRNEREPLPDIAFMIQFLIPGIFFHGPFSIFG